MKPRRYGVRIAQQAFCTFCGWSGAHWYGKGAGASAQGELNSHMTHSGACNTQQRTQRKLPDGRWDFQA